MQKQDHRQLQQIINKVESATGGKYLNPITSDEDEQDSFQDRTEQPVVDDEKDEKAEHASSSSYYDEDDNQRILKNIIDCQQERKEAEPE